MLQWPHSGFHVHAGVGVPEDDRAFALRLARYSGWYASRTRGARRRLGLAAAGPAAAVPVVEPVAWSLRAARARGHRPDPRPPGASSGSDRPAAKPSAAPPPPPDPAAERPGRDGHGLSGRGPEALPSAAAVVLVLAAIGFAVYGRERANPLDSIAVLPFAIRTNDPDDEYISDGITESISNSLTRA